MSTAKLLALTSAITLVLCLLVAFLLKSGLPMMLPTLIVIPLGIFFLNHQKAMYALMIMTMFSGLYIPGLPDGFGIQTLLAAAYLGVCILNMAMTKAGHAKSSGFNWLLLFTLHMVLVVVLHGSGFRFLGSSDWGGLRYVQIFIALLLMLNARRIVFTHQEWRKILIGTLIFAFLPFAAELLFLISGGRIYHQYYFIRLDAGTILSYFSEQGGGELIRFQSGNRLGGLLVLFSLIEYVILPRRKWIAIPFYLFGFLLVGFSGHRSGFLDILILSTFAVIITPGKLKWTSRILALGIAASILLAGLYLGAEKLPLSFQRMVSFLPGIQVHPQAVADAQFSGEWRLQLWGEAIDMIRREPEILLFGRGYTYSSAEYDALTYGSEGEYTYWWAYITLVFHQGILSLIIGTGLVGLFLFVMLTLNICINHFRYMRSSWKDSTLHKIHIFLGFYFLLQTLKYYVFFGDLHFSLPILAYWYLILEGLVVSEQPSKTDENPQLPPAGTNGKSSLHPRIGWNP